MRISRPRTRAAGAAVAAAEPRRGVHLAVAGALLAASLSFVAAAQLGGGSASPCGPDGSLQRVGLGPVACVHEDEAPAGVDVTAPVSTTDLKARKGGGLRAYKAAQQLGVPMAVASVATSPAVTCDGDGTSGYRVQAMYVVEADKTNRFSSLLSSFKLWAAGVDDVFNRSAALTGGVRHLRYVTEAGATSGTCEAKVLNVTVPAGSMSSFNATIQAVQALGYTNPARKYLMWTDATVLCGIATMYPNDAAAQTNPNNGSYAQYARVDSGCWGGGNGTSGHSVEAHELSHTLGSVQNTAPHSTNAGHCWDEADTMCYADGGNHAMVSVCPAEREYLLDCNTDDYYSTYPDPGSYLDTHWNTADNRFLIGGGDGSGGGTTGSPTVLGATLGVNNPAVPGLKTQVEVTPALPDGRTLTSVRWTSKRADCVFSAPTDLQSDVTCAAAATGSTTVTATLVDSTGATKAVTGSLTFASGAARAVSLDLAVAGQDAADVTTASVCAGGAFPLQTTVTDVATGLPVKGLAAAFTKKTEAMTAPATAGSGATTIDGVATASATATVSTTYAARVAATTVYAAGASDSLAAVPGVCATDLSAEADTTEVFYGDPVTVSGRLTRQANGATVGVAGVSLPVKQATVVSGATKVVTLATAKTGADGSYSIVVKPTVSGVLAVALAASAGYEARAAEIGTVTVTLPETELAASVDTDDVGYGDTVTATGHLTKTAGSLSAGVVGAALTVYVTTDGGAVVKVAAGKTVADGAFTIAVPLKVSGSLRVVFAGSAGLPAADDVVGPVTAGTWATALTLSGSAVPPSVNLTGKLTRTYADASSGPKGVKVKIYFAPTGGAPVLVTSATTLADGAFTAKVAPKASGAYTAVVSATVGYADAQSPSVGVTLG